MITTRTLSLPGVISSHGTWSPEADAVVCDDERLSWRELTGRVNQVANALISGGLKKGDRVATVLDNSIAFLEVLLGTMASGGVTVPLSKLASDDALCRMASDSGAAFLLFDEDSLALAMTIRAHLPALGCDSFVSVGGSGGEATSYRQWRDAASPDPPDIQYRFEDTISILYTSGTTGTPKGMEHTHFSRLLYPLVLGRRFNIDSSSRVILTTPMYHNGTWTTMLPALFHGACTVILRKFSAAEFQKVVEREGCTTAFMVPTQLNVLAASLDVNWDHLRSMRLVMVSGAPLSSRTFESFGDKLPSMALCQIYGMGEGFMTFAGPADYARGKAGSVGRPMLEVDTDIQILDDEDRPLPPSEVGEIVGTSAFLLSSYWANPDLTEASTWRSASGRSYLRSGDLGHFDPDGYLYIVGRKKDVIISGGVKIYSSDIEETFAQHPDVQEAAVVGLPHPKWGETPVLFAILRSGAATTAPDLREWGNARLGKTQRVVSVEIRETLPRNALGKVLKRELAAESASSANPP